MFELDHVAIQTRDIGSAVLFYVERFGAEILHEDSSWAFLRIGPGKLALVSPDQHPAHVALRVDLPTLEREAAAAGVVSTVHRDGTRGIYIEDGHGNVVELIHYPESP